MNNKRLVLFFLAHCFLCLGLGIFAESNDIFSKLPLEKELVLELLQNESIISISYKNKEVQRKIAPKSHLVEEAKQMWQKTHDDRALIEIEGLFLYKKPENESILLESSLENQDSSKISSIFTSISKMKGMEYYSERKKKNQILYDDFYVIDSNETKNRIPDPKVNSLENLHILVLQKDTSFGAYVMDVAYFQEGSERAMYMKNIDPLKYLLFKAIQQDNLHLYLYTYELDEYILIYVFVQADYLNISILNQTIEKSLVNRIDAIYNWFKIQYGGQK